VFVNDARMATEWGNILHTHLSNFRYADANLDFDYFVLLSSSCMLVRSGAAERIAEYDYGVDLPVAPIEWEWRAKSEDDPIFQGIKRDCGAVDCRGSQSEGTYYRREIFRQVADLIDRHWSFTPGHIRVHEEIYLPTIASTLGGHNSSNPIILKEDPRRLPPLDAKVVEAIRSENLEKLLDGFQGAGPRMRLIDEGRLFFGLRPIRRSMGDPVRSYIRSLPA
jgi:hypothetical protein